MKHKSDISINIPVEYYDDLVEIFAKGLKHAKISTESKKELNAWLTVERELIADAITSNE